MSYNIISKFVLVIIFLLSCSNMLFADDDISLSNIDSEFGGHFKLRGRSSWYDSESFYGSLDSGTYYDFNSEFRLKNELFFADWGAFVTHYEAVFGAGDTRKNTKKLFQSSQEESISTIFSSQTINDDRRLMDLTRVFSEGDDYVSYHRLDRFFLTLLPSWGSVKLGRQAVTWGNGLLFNPFDLFNPFSPTDIERDYKVGDDLLSVEANLSKESDFQFLIVPRRDPITSSLEADSSSFAGKFHFSHNEKEFSLILAKHYEDTVVGLGGVGYIKDAAWRINATWTFLDKEYDYTKSGFLSLVGNIDYSWVWWSKNLYGYLEFYFNSLGDDDYDSLIDNDAIIERINRGELFTLGRAYLSANMRLEVHPLLNLYLTIINNIEDSSGMLQPRCAWDIMQDLDLTLGANLPYGGKGSEYGGIPTTNSNYFIQSPSSLYLWLSWYF